MQTRRTARGAGGGVAFFAHVGGFIFGLLVARLLARPGQAAPGEQWRSTA
jgi:membrane associated rhomboid family serine protease